MNSAFGCRRPRGWLCFHCNGHGYFSWFALTVGGGQPVCRQSNTDHLALYGCGTYSVCFVDTRIISQSAIICQALFVACTSYMV